MHLYQFILLVVLCLWCGYFSTMFLTLIGICVLAYVLFYLFCVLMLDSDVRLACAETFGKSIASLKSKVVFITGASSGIGEYTALALAKNGVRLVLAARRPQELNRVKEDCLSASKGQLTSGDILVLPMDVLRYDLHQKYFDDALQHFGQVDIVLNNAGRSQRAHWENIDLQVDKEMFDLNVFAVVNFSRVALKYFLGKKEGHIAVTSSITGITGLPFSASYTGSKHALHGYFNCLRNEKMLDNISVTLLCPGPTFTNFLQNCFTENKDKTFGQRTSPTDKRLSAERCGHLCAVALANKLDESWMGVLPLMPLLYLAVYSPVTHNLLLKFFGPEKLYKFRDSKE